jgi:hypothetical protein
MYPDYIVLDLKCQPGISRFDVGLEFIQSGAGMPLFVQACKCPGVINQDDVIRRERKDRI